MLSEAILFNQAFTPVRLCEQKVSIRITGTFFIPQTTGLFTTFIHSILTHSRDMHFAKIFLCVFNRIAPS